MTDALLKIPNQAVNFSLVPVDQLAEMLRAAVRDEIQSSRELELQEKFLSPQNSTKLFDPNVSIGTLNNWARKGLIKKYHIGNLTFYKYSELVAAVGKVKKYSRQ